MRQFNTTGTCFPQIHYMVDISRQVNDAVKMVKNNKYFCINRGRQFGKTTTLNILQKTLAKEGYIVFSLSFEGLGDKEFESLESVCNKFMNLVKEQIQDDNVENISENLKSKFENFQPINDIAILKSIVKKICSENPNIVVIIDEVDQASNHESFIKFLGFFRDLYLKRIQTPTFQSLILAGVYNIKNLKLKMRPDDEHQYNSPWNIASSFETDMSLHTDGIAKMLSDYKVDHNLEFDENHISQKIYDWTSGYPYFVSRICELIDTKNLGWNDNGINEAVKYILSDSNDVLLEDFSKKLDDFPDLKQTLKMILFEGYQIMYNPDEKYIKLGFLFNILKKEGNNIAVFNRILETRLYNLFFIENKFEQLFNEGIKDKNQFTKNGFLDIQKILEKFAIHFRDNYGDRDEKFIEKEGRKFFMLYLRPIINGASNYYIEAETRDYTRTDIIIDYQSKQYIVEIKIWNGEEYNRKGEIQLSEYLDYYHLTEGYMLSFCFNKNKIPGAKTIEFGDKILHEVIV
ncbi:MAG: AAA-like domain-containing protein [Bacteroidales bacterium]|nr:AAA-like domain-containing protein [Bacteroidales bacterium]